MSDGLCWNSKLLFAVSLDYNTSLLSEFSCFCSSEIVLSIRSCFALTSCESFYYWAFGGISKAAWVLTLATEFFLLSAWVFLSGGSISEMVVMLFIGADKLYAYRYSLFSSLSRLRCSSMTDVTNYLFFYFIFLSLAANMSCICYIWQDNYFWISYIWFESSRSRSLSFIRIGDVIRVSSLAVGAVCFLGLSVLVWTRMTSV